MAAAAEYARAHPADGPEDLPLQNRCLCVGHGWTADAAGSIQ